MPAPRRTVGELMSSPPVTATPSETVAETAARMREHQVGSVVVVDGRRPIGILTERDLIRFAAAGGEVPPVAVGRHAVDDTLGGSPIRSGGGRGAAAGGGSGAGRGGFRFHVSIKQIRFPRGKRFASRTGPRAEVPNAPRVNTFPIT